MFCPRSEACLRDQNSMRTSSGTFVSARLQVRLEFTHQSCIKHGESGLEMRLPSESQVLHLWANSVISHCRINLLCVVMYIYIIYPVSILHIMHTYRVLYIRSTRFLFLDTWQHLATGILWNSGMQCLPATPHLDDFNFLCSITRGPMEWENSVGVHAGELPFPSASPQYEDGEKWSLAWTRS